MVESKRACGSKREKFRRTLADSDARPSYLQIYANSRQRRMSEMRLYSQPVIGTFMRLAYSPTWGLVFSQRRHRFTYFLSAAVVPKQVTFWECMLASLLCSSVAMRGGGQDTASRALWSLLPGAFPISRGQDSPYWRDRALLRRSSACFFTGRRVE